MISIKDEFDHMVICYFKKIINKRWKIDREDTYTVLNYIATMRTITDITLELMTIIKKNNKLIYKKLIFIYLRL